MESEIQWLLHILLEQKLSPQVKKMFLARIGEVEKSLKPQPRVLLNSNPGATSHIPEHMIPLEDVGQTQAAQHAIAARQQTIAQAMSGKSEIGRTSPRKF